MNVLTVEVPKGWMKSNGPSYGKSTASRRVTTGRDCHLKLYSLERHRKGYIIIYIWKVLERLVPNVN